MFPSQPGRKGFAQRVSNRQIFEAVRYRERVGCPWRDLPASYGPWHTIYMRWKRWVAAQVPQRVMRALPAARRQGGKLDLSLALLDSTVVRAHQHAAGARKKRPAVPGAQPRGPEHQDPCGQRRRATRPGRGSERRAGR